MSLRRGWTCPISGSRNWSRRTPPKPFRLATTWRPGVSPTGYEYRMMAADGRMVWIRESGTVLVEKGQPVAMRGIFQDITQQKLDAQQLDKLNRQLMDTSRQAGMAEVATGVLHNVGNVLNSVSVSATLVADRLRRSKVDNLRRATTLLREQNGHLAEFLTTDPKGKLLPEYLGTVADQLAGEQTKLIDANDHGRPAHRAHQGDRGDAAELCQGIRRL